MSEFRPRLDVVYQVSELAGEVRLLLESSYPAIWVEGEISNLSRPASGHLYFSLKDEKSQIRCAFFRKRMTQNNYRPTDGMRVRVKAQVSLYQNRGDFQLIVTKLEPAGVGDLRAAFDKLKEKLAKEGLFSVDNKKSLPGFPVTIGIITSPSGAVVKDIITTCRRRYPVVKLLIYPVQVQGEKAAKQIAHAVTQADKDRFCDILIVGRGGGSLEDLWAFNEEELARAIFACQTPIISAVGHDIDFTISDFVADVRASTPTGAAELATPDSEQLFSQFNQLQNRLSGLIRHTLINRIQLTDLISRRLIHPAEKLKYWKQLNVQLTDRLKAINSNQLDIRHQYVKNLFRMLCLNSPVKCIEQHQKNLSNLNHQLLRGIRRCLDQLTTNLNSINNNLIAISPQSTLERGYAIVNQVPSNTILRSVNQVESNTKIQVRLFDGSFNATTDELSH